MNRKRQGYDVKVACIFDLSPVSPKGEKRFDLLIKKQKPNGDDMKGCTEANRLLPFRGGKGEVGVDFIFSPPPKNFRHRVTVR